MNNFRSIIALSVTSLCILLSSGFTYGNNSLDEELIMRTEFSRLLKVDENYNKYFNFADGYSLKFPSEFTIDDSIGEVKVALNNQNTVIEIYNDSFYNSEVNGNIYSTYSNKNIIDNEYIQVRINGSFEFNGYKINLLRWDRKKLSRINNDKNHYISAEIFKNNKEVYTILIKSEDPNFPYLEIIENFSITSKSEPVHNRRIFESKSLKFNEETREFYNDYLLNSDKLRWGIFEPTAPREMDYLNELEEKLSYEFDYLLKYQHLNSILSVDELVNASKENKYLELTLQTTIYGEKFNSNINYEILEGNYDEFLNKYALTIKEYGSPVLFRLNNEMNGDWCAYNAFYNGKDTEIYKEVWKYIYGIFEKNNVENAIWVWNPNNLDFPRFKWNHYLNYYPGDEYVDIIGLTAYNTGSYHVGETWNSFNYLYEPLYREYMETFKFPFIITEFASNSVGGNKEEWIEDMFMSIGKYDNIKMATWFNGTDLDAYGRPARIYRLDENELIINKFREMFNRE